MEEGTREFISEGVGEGQVLTLEHVESRSLALSST